MLTEFYFITLDTEFFFFFDLIFYENSEFFVYVDFHQSYCINSLQKYFIIPFECGV